MPGSVRRDPDSLKVNFSLYDAEGSVTVSYEGILPTCSARGGGGAGHHGEGQPRPAQEVLAKHDENYTRRKWKRRCRKTTAARNALIRTPHHDA